MHKSTAVILLAGGTGSRVQSDQAKQFIHIAGKPVLVHSHDAIRRHLPESLIVVVVPLDSIARVKAMLNHDSNTSVVAGGSCRLASTHRGLQALQRHAPENVLIHDAARPFVSGQIIADVMQALEKNEAVDVAIPTADTIIVERDGYIQSIPKRQHLLRGQTPQAFRYPTLLRCYEEIGEERLEQFTDDCGIYLECHPMGRIRVVKGDEKNIKITTALDLTLADEMFRLQDDALNDHHPGIDIRGKGIVIFGSESAIGRASLDVLGAGGAKIYGASRKNNFDITNIKSIERQLQNAQKEIGDIDIVINVVGQLTKTKLTDFPSDGYKEEVAVNLIGAINIAKASYPFLEKTKGILQLYSSSSYTRGRAEIAVYSSTKAAVVNLAQALNEEWAKAGVKVQCVIPTRTDSPMRHKNFKNEDRRTLKSPYEVALIAGKALSKSRPREIVRC